MTMGILLALMTAVPARAQGAAAAFSPEACAGRTAPDGWKPFSDRWLTGSAAPDWRVLDNLDRLQPVVSTSVASRLVVDLDFTLRSATVPVLALFGTTAPGQLPSSAGAWLSSVLADARSRGDDALGQSGFVDIPGLGMCQAGAVESMARRACGPGVEQDCRRAAMHVDCGAHDGMAVSMTLETPPYTKRGQPGADASEAVAWFKSLLCTLRYRGPSASK
ncbi:MAG: hypothetical protein KGL53_15160 [Elusimicrobia bacterium]|nr:hypothetical protein [Elusimicrobiota bacterium]